jgi:hypothetical protein
LTTVQKTKKKSAALFGAIGLIIVAVAILFWNFAPAKKYAQNSLYFSDDGGKTWYVDANTNIPPYQHNGKEAVGAALYRTENSSTPFCGYLYRFPAAVKAQLEGMDAAARVSAAYSSATASAMEVCKPDSNGAWARVGTAAGNKAMTVVSPDGSELDRVLP